MPLDPSILLNTGQRHPGILDHLGQALQIKGMQQQQQAQELSLDEQRRAVADDRATRALFGGQAAPTPQQIYSTAGPTRGAAIVKGMAEQQKAGLERQKLQGELRAQQVSRLGQLAQAGSESPLAAASVIRTAIEEGHLSEEVGQQLAALPWDQLQGKMKQFGAQAMTVAQQLKAREDAAAAERAAETHGVDMQTKRAALPGVEAGALSKQLTVAGQTVAPLTDQQQYDEWLAKLPPEMQRRFPSKYSKEALHFIRRMAMTPDQQESADARLRDDERQGAAQTETARHNRAMEARPTAGQWNAYPVSPSATQEGKFGEEFLTDLKRTSPAMAMRVKAIADGRDTIPTGRAASTGAGKQLADAVYRYDPTFSTQRAQIRRAFTTGKDGQNIGALNTAIVHLGRLGEAAEALQNGNFTPGNEAYNYFRDKLGDPAIANFELLKDAVAGEMAAALKGTATDVEIANMKRSIRASNSPAQMRGVVREGMSVLRDKTNTYVERYRRQVPDDTWSPVLPSAQKALELYGAGPASGGGAAAAGLTVTAPNGKSYSFPNAAQADAFKKRAGIR